MTPPIFQYSHPTSLLGVFKINW